MNSVDIFLPIASVVFIYLARMIELGANRDTIPGPVRERLTLRLFMLAGSLMAVGAIVELLITHRGLNWWMFGGGWACAIASVAIRRRAIAALGKFWSLHVEIRQNHQFVHCGPFRWVRHPTYFSMILELLSLGLITSSVYALLAVAALFVPTLILRIKLEEAALVEKFGDVYRHYQRATPALFPYKPPQAK